jgi:hypothetical protein
VSDAATEGIITCPYCKDNVQGLVSIDPGMRLRLQNEAQLVSLPETVCAGCFAQLSKMVSKGAVLRAEAQAKEQNRLMLWRNRVQLVRQAKQHLAQKDYSGAAVAYEKYIRVLEIVYDCKQGELKPEMFKSAARAQEMTVIASVYWDLMRIYDTNSRYAERQSRAAEKLAAFVRFTPIFPQIMRKADTQTRTAKNPESFKKFLKLSNSNRPRCFIATAAFDGEREETVEALCEFRDGVLRATPSGRRMIHAYYKVSPRIASLLDRHPAFKPMTRKLLKWTARIISRANR